MDNLFTFYTQVLRWIDPLAEYLVLSSKNTALPKDVSAWVIRTVADNTAIFSNSQRLSNEVSSLMLKTILYQL